MGDEGGVLCDDDVAWVGDDAVVPEEEFAAHVGDGLDGGRVTIMVDASSGDGAATDAVDLDGEGVFGLRRGRFHNEVGDDAFFGLIEDFAVFINRLCVSVIYAILVDDQIADSRKFGQGVEHLAVLPNIKYCISHGKSRPI